MPSKYDVVVVGGGPAGSTVARESSRRGARVVLIDKAEFPRDKPCGGGVTPRALALLPFAIDPVVERRIHAVRFSVRPGTSITRRSDEPITYLTQRRDLDTWLLERAEEGGVRVLQRCGVRGMVRGPRSGWIIETKEQTLHADVVIGADGANGPTARLSGLDGDRWTGIAFEGNVPAHGTFPTEWSDTMGIDFGYLKSGYSWVFPKREHLNVGVGGWRGAGPNLRKSLAAYARSHDLDSASFENLRGHPLPVRKPGAPIAANNVFLVGDAAGLLDPFTGEGIYAAIWSGRVAAGHVQQALNGDHRAFGLYRDEIDQGIGPDLRVSRKLYDLFHLCPWLWTQGLREDRIWDLACRLLRGEQTYSRASGSSGWKGSLLSLVYEGLKLATRWSSSSNAASGYRRPLYFAS